MNDPWLITYGYIMKQRVDLAMEYLLHFEHNTVTPDHIYKNHEDYHDYVEMILNFVELEPFNHRLLIFAKNLEKLYVSY